LSSTLFSTCRIVAALAIQDLNLLIQQEKLASASQKSDEIDATLYRGCEVGRILRQFASSPLPNFCYSGLGLVPKHDGVGELYVTSLHLHSTALMIK